MPGWHRITSLASFCSGKSMQCEDCRRRRKGVPEDGQDVSSLGQFFCRQIETIRSAFITEGDLLRESIECRALVYYGECAGACLG